MHVTLEEIARLANTSSSTVSRVLADRPGVAQATRDRVHALATKLGYRPDFRARSLVTRRTRTVGLVTSYLAGGWYAQVLRSLSRHLTPLGYHVLVADSGLDIEEEKRNIEAMQSHRVEALFVCPVGDWNTDLNCNHLLELKLQGLPVVILGNPPNCGGLDCVYTDDVESSLALTRHLLALGHRRFGVLGHTPEIRGSRERVQGIGQAIIAAGSPPGPQSLPEPPALRICLTDIRHYDPHSMRQTVLGWLKEPDPPTALIGIGNLYALDLYGPLEDWGYQIPEDISVAAYEDDFWCPRIRPGLSVVYKNEDEVAQRALEVWMRRVKHPEAPPLLVTAPQHFIARDSTGPCPGCARPAAGFAAKGVI